MGNRIRVLKKEPGKKARWVEIENELRPMQEAVGGRLESATLFEDLVILCDEEGRLKGLPYNCKICGIDFVGPILICGVEDEELADLRLSPEAAEVILPDIDMEDDESMADMLERILQRILDVMPEELRKTLAPTLEMGRIYRRITGKLKDVCLARLDPEQDPETMLKRVEALPDLVEYMELMEAGLDTFIEAHKKKWGIS